MNTPSEADLATGFVANVMTFPVSSFGEAGKNFFVKAVSAYSSTNERLMVEYNATPNQVTLTYQTAMPMERDFNLEVIAILNGMIV